MSLQFSFLTTRSNSLSLRYTASKETGTINTVETLGVSTSKVAELQHESVWESSSSEAGDGASVRQWSVIINISGWIFIEKLF